MITLPSKKQLFTSGIVIGATFLLYKLYKRNRNDKEIKKHMNNNDVVFVQE